MCGLLNSVLWDSSPPERSSGIAYYNAALFVAGAPLFLSLPQNQKCHDAIESRAFIFFGRQKASALGNGDNRASPTSEGNDGWMTGKKMAERRV